MQLHWAIENMFAMTDDKGDMIKIKTTPARLQKKVVLTLTKKWG